MPAGEAPGGRHQVGQHEQAEQEARGEPLSEIPILRRRRLRMRGEVEVTLKSTTASVVAPTIALSAICSHPPLETTWKPWQLVLVFTTTVATLRG